MSRDIGAFVARLKSIEPRLDISYEDLVELFWQAHPRFHFFKSLPWGANLLDIGAGGGGLVHWKAWLKPQRNDLNLYGVDRNVGEYRDLYADWEAINLDRDWPRFAGVKLNAFFASHLLEYLGAPETLVEWLGTRAEPGARLYLEWTNPLSLELPTREQLHKFDIDVVTSNFVDDWEHKQAPDLARLCSWLAAAGFELISSGAIDLGILGEELFARGTDRNTRSMGYWSVSRSSLYAIAVKSGEAVMTARESDTPIGASPVAGNRAQPPGAAKTIASDNLESLRAKRSLLTSGLFDAAFYRETYADMRASTLDPLTHYITRGEAEGRNPNAVFFPRYYRRQWMAGRPAERNALLHYAEEGERRGLKPHPAFDPRAYLAANPPLAEFVDRPLFHYLTIGRVSGLPVAPGPHGEALARVLAAQPHAAAFEYSGQRDRHQLNRYKEVLVQQLGADEGLVFYKEMFDLPESDGLDIDNSVIEQGARGADRGADSSAEQLDYWVSVSESVPGTTRGELARELARTSLLLPPDAIIVEIGVFMGSATVLLAGPRKMRGSGKVHAVDPFDCSGDPRSTPVYQRVLQGAGGGSLLDHFGENIQRAGLTGWVEVHQGRAAEIAANWTSPVDMIYIDLDVSGEAAGEAYDNWHQFLKPGGIIVVHNSDPDDDRPDANGDRTPIEERIRPPRYVDIRAVDGNTFAHKSA